MGNGAPAEYVNHRVSSIIPKRDAINALKVALDIVKGREVTDAEVLAFVNHERTLLGRRPLKLDEANP